ncbi:MAG: thiamine pyrophosphate-dependent enzyme [Burkholderiales bacterium]
MRAADLVAFEREVADAFEAKKIHAPIHLAGGNEDQLIEIFREVQPNDWVLTSWRSHYHALLKNIPRELVMAEILAGRSMALNFPEHRFLTSAIMGGILPIACGLAAAGERVWCFVGDMCASTGAFADAAKYTGGQGLPIEFVIEDNGLATNTPTADTWGAMGAPKVRRYSYERTFPHVGCGVYVAF